MDMVLASVYETGFCLRGTCPHCDSKSAFVSVTKPYFEEYQGGLVQRIVAALRCEGCNGYILGILRMEPVPLVAGRYASVYEAHYPLGKPPQVISEAIPENIREDFNEALKCRWVDAYNATVEMCRRALQSSCEELGADPKISIEAQIDWIASQGKITSFLRDMAHTIRLAGNRGAHPPRAITGEEADAVIQFTREYFQHVYMTAARMKKYDFSKSPQKKKP